MTQIDVIDISEHNIRNGRIDFNKVKASGVSGVMIRAGWAGYNGALEVDTGLDDTISRAAKAGLGVGLYVYTYATSAAAATIAARQTAQIALRHVGEITYPIAYDVEEQQTDVLIRQGREGLTNHVIAFLSETERLGWYAVWYTGTAFARQYLNISRLARYDLWVADYRGKQKLDAQLGRSYGMWQYVGDAGRCPGVIGSCDRNYAYRDYESIIRRTGMNGLANSKK